MIRSNMNIRVTFYLKSTTKKSKRMAIYASIGFKGKRRQIATGLFCDDPKNDWERGGLKGKHQRDNQSKLSNMAMEIEAYDAHEFVDVDQVIDKYYGVETESYCTTILEALDYAYKSQDNLVSRTTRRHITTMNHFKDFIKSNPKIYSNFSIIKGHNRQMFRKHSKDFKQYLMLQTNVKQNSTVFEYFSGVKSLFNKFKEDHKDMIPNIIDNPFVGIVKAGSNEERKKKALARAIPWSFIERIEKVRHKNLVEEKWRLLALIQSYTGLSWIEFGKEDVFDIKTMIGGSALINRRVKQKKEYLVFLSKKVINLIRDIGELPFKPFVFDLKFKDADNAKNYGNYKNYLKKLAKEIEFDDGHLTSHRFRHSFGMQALNVWKIPLHIVAKMMGDEVRTVAENYADLNRENIILEQKNCMEAYVEKTA